MIRYRDSLELFLINGKLEAQQQAQAPVYMKEDFYETKHFYCPKCGEVWAMRVDPSQPATWHSYRAARCLEHSGTVAELLTPYEWENLEELGPNVLAFLLLNLTEGWKDETGTPDNQQLQLQQDS